MPSPGGAPLPAGFAVLAAGLSPRASWWWESPLPVQTLTVNDDVDAVDHRGALERGTQFLGDADRGNVLGMNDTEDVVGTEHPGGVVDRGASPFGGESLPPPGAPK